MNIAQLDLLSDEEISALDISQKRILWAKFLNLCNPGRSVSGSNVVYYVKAESYAKFYELVLNKPEMCARYKRLVRHTGITAEFKKMVFNYLEPILTRIAESPEFLLHELIPPNLIGMSAECRIEEIHNLLCDKMRLGKIKAKFECKSGSGAAWYVNKFVSDDGLASVVYNKKHLLSEDFSYIVFAVLHELLHDITLHHMTGELALIPKNLFLPLKEQAFINAISQLLYLNFDSYPAENGHQPCEIVSNFAMEVLCNALQKRVVTTFGDEERVRRACFFEPEEIIEMAIRHRNCGYDFENEEREAARDKAAKHILANGTPENLMLFADESNDTKYMLYASVLELKYPGRRDIACRGYASSEDFEKFRELREDVATRTKSPEGTFVTMYEESMLSGAFAHEFI